MDGATLPQGKAWRRWVSRFPGVEYARPVAELRPYPFASLVKRALTELSEGQGIFDLPRRKFFLGDAERDLSVMHHGVRVGSPLGPAAGPHTQMAQNLVLSWLAGCRILELKTVQIMDELEIPRPCIDMETIGYNVEWSQELKLEESLEEYVKGAMLIEILGASGELPLEAGFESLIYDMSVGYDLAGIKTERVQAFIDGMMDCTEVVDRLRKQIPDEYKQYRDLDFQTRLSQTLTLSTFHGCPPDEIERIIEFLIDEKKLHCTVKLNPTLLGPERCHELLVDTLGYQDLHIPEKAFEEDTKWEQASAFLDRLGQRAEKQGLSFGAKFTNTLIVDNHRSFFPEAEKQMYMSGPPLHVLAVNLVAKTREAFGDRFPISFSAGIDAQNFADSVALGLTPITVCSDLLKPGGYGRASSYYGNLQKRMDAVGASSIPDFIIRAFGHGEAALDSLGLEGDAREVCKGALEGGGDLATAAGDHLHAWVSAALLANTRTYSEACTADGRYALAKNSKSPRKLGSHLELFDCVSCNKCVPVCPNDANFILEIPTLEQPIVHLSQKDSAWSARTDGTLTIAKKKQYANFADFCNECGNCDIFCPEDGGPYVVKPRFFGNLADFEEMKNLDGFFLVESGVRARIGGKSYSLSLDGEQASYSGEGFELRFLVIDPVGTVAGQAAGEVDLTYFHIMQWIRDAALKSSSSYVRYLAT